MPKIKQATGNDPSARQFTQLINAEKKLNRSFEREETKNRARKFV